MRNKRLGRFKKIRHKKTRHLVLLTFMMPALLILLGYLVASMIILPSMHS